ncbi:DNA-directed RNA polymerase subunit omega [Jeotgalicoccus coquinae]|uniref:DNA-directed RNA polymerase subunit omega n=1 Tax=Jeotgalicoccus coquinae TaxID=709509 RepID=A0A6V7RJ36_9STAP|nr:DNA-directed RNA polymerase subunit omega [Jeotgalicoccus coquinae]MBB6422557.1 DNA-directed RNA polymerase subunit omega [Jeotgalicoccus coquinae]GGE14936.1 DNA-directed RNA polymerase subunit omega [Jeotgalicoccus coquinae]CAD2078095.1 DNA-directed RNA polymerase subunit omega [Jeotgalicoccus coquinae]
MLYPAGHELKKNVDSKYLVVTMAAKRARQLQDNPEGGVLESYQSKTNVGYSLEEIAAGKVTVHK